MSSNVTNRFEATGRELVLNNQGIVKYLCSIEDERGNLEHIIQKQYQERKKIEAEIEKLTYKLCLINKSLSMRIKAKNNYDKTIEEIKTHYEKLVDSSNALRQIVEKTQQELDGIMNKKIGTAGPDGEEIRMLYVKQTEPPGPDECGCGYNRVEAPTKDYTQSENFRQPSPPHSEHSQDDSYRFSGNYDARSTDTAGSRREQTGDFRKKSSQASEREQSKVTETTSDESRPTVEHVDHFKSTPSTPSPVDSIGRSTLPALTTATATTIGTERKATATTIGTERKATDISTNVLMTRLKSQSHMNNNVKTDPSKIERDLDLASHQESSVSVAPTKKIDKKSVTELLDNDYYE